MLGSLKRDLTAKCNIGSKQTWIGFRFRLHISCLNRKTQRKNPSPKRRITGPRISCGANTVGPTSAFQRYQTLASDVCRSRTTCPRNTRTHRMGSQNLWAIWHYWTFLRSKRWVSCQLSRYDDWLWDSIFYEKLSWAVDFRKKPRARELLATKA
jgi:hypothetical protein